jgi:4-methylaminobutanoate oxidase (formaldehyde-forming)
MVQLRRTAAVAEAFGLDCEIIDPVRARERYPIMETGDLVGAIWLPDDGKANPTDLTYALAKGARAGGAVIRERTRVTGIRTAGGAVTGVTTDEGDVEAEIVVNCAGQWAKQVGAWCGVTVPLHSCEHFYVVTEQIDGVHRDLPVLRDPDGYTYFKEEVGGLVVGGFEPNAKPWVAPDALAAPVRVPAAGRGLGPLLAAHGQRRGAGPRARARGHQEVLQRAGELHPRQPVHPR